MSKRSLQLASIVHRAVQSVITDGLADPRLDAMITITRVKVADDASSATIHVSIFPEKAESKAIHALQDAARYIRRQAAERVSIHRMPHLLFKIDHALKKQAELTGAFSKIEQERAQAAHPDQHTDETPQSTNHGDQP